MIICTTAASPILASAVVSGPQGISEYLVADKTSVNSTEEKYAERYIHSEILKKYLDMNSVVHSHSEDVPPYTVLEAGEGLQSVYHMAGFRGMHFPLPSSLLPRGHLFTCIC